MTAPAIYIGFLIASACGLLFHLIRGGSISRLWLFLATAWVSFLAGHLLAEWIDWQALRIGSLNLLPALLATLIGLLTASVLAGAEEKPRTRRRR